MEHPLVSVMRAAQITARLERRTIYVIQDELYTHTLYSIITPEDFAKNPAYPIIAIINGDGLIVANNL